jgi:tryptophanyl-tRNA synthetase
MSKSSSSQNGVIDLLDDPKIIAKRIRSAVTDTGREIRFDPAEKPGVSNLLSILGALSGRSMDGLEADYDGKGYGDLKKDVTEIVIETATPYRDRTLALLADPAELDRILAEGAERARDVASKTLARVYDRVGFLPSKR